MKIINYLIVKFYFLTAIVPVAAPRMRYPFPADAVRKAHEVRVIVDAAPFTETPHAVGLEQTVVFFFFFF